MFVQARFCASGGLVGLGCCDCLLWQGCLLVVSCFLRLWCWVVYARCCGHVWLFFNIVVLGLFKHICVTRGLAYQAFVFVFLDTFVCTVLVCLSRLLCLFVYARLCASVGFDLSILLCLLL